MPEEKELVVKLSVKQVFLSVAWLVSLGVLLGLVGFGYRLAFLELKHNLTEIYQVQTQQILERLDTLEKKLGK